MAEAKKAIILQPITIDTVSLRIVGTSPIVQHKWSEKAKKMLRDKHAGVKTKTRDKRDPKAEFEACLYVGQETNQFGVPCNALKNCIINAAHKDIGVEKTLIRKSVFIGAQDIDKDEKVDMVLFDTADKPEMREDIVRVGTGTADLRYRPEFKKWSILFNVQMNTDAIQLDTFVNLVNLAGFGVGLHEMRPQKSGDYGRFKIDENHLVTGNKQTLKGD